MPDVDPGKETTPEAAAYFKVRAWLETAHKQGRLEAETLLVADEFCEALGFPLLSGEVRRWAS